MLGYLMFHKSFFWPDEQKQLPSSAVKELTMQENEYKGKHRVHLAGASLWRMGRKLWSFSRPKLFIRQISVHCAVGFERPDLTAYAYGLVWALLSTLPASWQEHLTVDYQPVFEGRNLSLDVQGIILIPMGHLMLIVIYCLGLLGQEVWRQKRKEKKENENRLRRQLDGNSIG